MLSLPPSEPNTPKATREQRAWALYAVGTLGAIGVAVYAIEAYQIFNPAPDIGVYFRQATFACDWDAALKSARDLGVITQDMVEKALHNAVQDWFDGKTATVVIDIPKTPELDSAIRAQNRWAIVCAGHAPGAG